MKKLLLSFLLIVGLSACGGSEEKSPVVGEVNALYNKGLNLLLADEYSQAVHTFEELERQHPYSRWATRAQMMVVYAHYRAREYDEAVAGAQRFIQTHPGHKLLPYVHYLRAMSFYEQIADVRRDQGATRKAMSAFREIDKRFPETTYAQDARLKMTLTRDHLAGKEMEVGRFYQDKQQYPAALNRFQTVVQKYQQSSHTPEALFRMTEVYIALGIPQQAQRAAAILGHNYPDSAWYEYAYEKLQNSEIKPIDPEKAEEGGFLGILGF